MTMSEKDEKKGEESFVSTWKLPDNIEEHIEYGLMKAAAGAVAGATTGAVFFKSGRGYVGALALAGVGVAIGSTFERVKASQAQN